MASFGAMYGCVVCILACDAIQIRICLLLFVNGVFLKGDNRSVHEKYSDDSWKYS